LLSQRKQSGVQSVFPLSSNRQPEKDSFTKLIRFNFLLYCSLVLKLIYKCTYRYLCQTNLQVYIIHYYAKLFICNYVAKKLPMLFLIINKKKIGSKKEPRKFQNERRQSQDLLQWRQEYISSNGGRSANKFRKSQICKFLRPKFFVRFADHIYFCGL
jgi:hypothetical protein